MKRIISIIIIIYCHFSFSQEREASLIFYDNSKIKGLGEIKNNVIYFRLSETEKIEKWDSDIVKGLYFDGMGYNERYEFVKSDNYKKPFLMEVIEEGLVNIYRDVLVVNSYSGFGISRTSSSFIQKIYYVKKPNDDKAYDLNFNFKKKAEKLFDDCNELMEKIYSKEFTSKNIIEIVDFYNDYCGENKE